MGWGTRSALLLVDVCTAYFTEGSPLSLLSNPEAVAAPDSMRRLLAAARKGRVPVLWSKIEYLSPDMADAGLWWRKAKLLDVWRQGDLRGLDRDLDGLSPSEGDVVVVKKFASAFFGTRLAEELQVSLFFFSSSNPCPALGCWSATNPSMCLLLNGGIYLSNLQRLHVDTLVICGVSTSGCVRATALDAMQSGFRPMVSLIHSSICLSVHPSSRDKTTRSQRF